MPSALPAIPAKRYFTIGEVSELCGVKPHVLRYWEQEFAQLRPMKRRGNRRYYQHHEVLLVRRIRELLHEQGFTINGARALLARPAADAAAAEPLLRLAEEAGAGAPEGDDRDDRAGRPPATILAEDTLMRRDKNAASQKKAAGRSGGQPAAPVSAVRAAADAGATQTSPQAEAPSPQRPSAVAAAPRIALVAGGAPQVETAFAPAQALPATVAAAVSAASMSVAQLRRELHAIRELLLLP